MSKLKYIVIWCALHCLFCTTAWGQLNTDRITAIGRNALYFDDYVLSIQYFNQVIKLKPYLYEPYQLRAIAKIQLGDYQGALRDCNQAIELNPFQPGIYYTRGYIYRQLKDYASAESDFTNALHFSPESKTFMLLRADVRSSQQHYEQAIEDIDYLLGREPHSATLLLEKGIICMQKKDTLSALEAFQKTVQYDSQNAGNWSALGVTYLMLHQEEDALQSLNQAISLGSKWAGDYMNRANIYYTRHNYRAAITDIDHAISIDPNDAQLLYNRAMLRQELGDYNHAIEDLNNAIELDSAPTEFYYMRATIFMHLRQWNKAYQDLEYIIAEHPYFLPAYYMAAQAKTSIGNKKEAQQLRAEAFRIEQNKDSLRQQTLPTGMQIASAGPTKKDRRKEFSTRTAQNQIESTEEDKSYSSETRGSVQKRYTDVVNEPNVVLSYYSGNNGLRSTNYSHSIIDIFNRRQELPSTVRLTTQELTLTADMVSYHFDKITTLTRQIDAYERQYTTLTREQRSITNAQALYLARAMEFALVQDYTSALDDATRALRDIADKQKEALILFCRANWRFKQLQYMRATGELSAEAKMDFTIMLRDYDQVNRLIPDFAFAYYNKANMLCAQREFHDAIAHYTKAIEADSDFAEAYYNRGLTYIYTDNVEAGLQDLSKAGELGLYQAYNLITRFQ